MTERPRVRNITELAKLAGVNAATVSRALAGSNLIAQKTRERIQALAREHDFRPNIMARNLRIRRAGAIGVVIPLRHEAGQPISDPSLATMIDHLADALTERGYDLLLSRVIPDHPDWLSRIVDSGRVDGVVLIGQSDQAAVIEGIAARYLPLVVWGAGISGQVQCTVGSDNRKGGLLAAQHLIERGAKRLTFLGDPAVAEISDRLAGVRDAVSQAGLSHAPDVLPVSLAAQVAHQAIAAWLAETGHLPDGIVAASDGIAMSALRALSEAGIDVPGKVRVIGYGDLPFAGQTVPPLSSIRQDIAGGASHLVDMLFQRIGGQTTQQVVLDPVLVVRASG